MLFEYLTVEYSDLRQPLKFRFPDDSGVEANHLQEFLNRQGAMGWELLAALPLAYKLLKTKESLDLNISVCRLIFRRAQSAGPNLGILHGNPDRE